MKANKIRYCKSQTTLETNQKKLELILKNAGLKLAAIQNHFSLLYRNSEENGIMNIVKYQGIHFLLIRFWEIIRALTDITIIIIPFPKRTRRASFLGKQRLKQIEPLILEMKILD